MALKKTNPIIYLGNPPETPQQTPKSPFPTSINSLNYVYDGAKWEKEKQEFTKWLVDNGKLVFGYVGTAAGSQTMYTVPTKKVCYITSLSLYYYNTDLAESNAQLILKGADYLWLNAPPIANQHDVISLSFTIPIKLIEGETIIVHSGDTHMFAYGNYTGYEISTELI